MQEPLLMEERELERALLDVELPLVAHRLIQEGQDLAEAARSLRAPYVLKAVVPGLAHRTERGAVVMGLRDLPELLSAASRFEALFGAQLQGLLLQEQLAPSPELYLGFARDRAFGAVLLLGAGGIEVELDPDICARLWPPLRAEGERVELSESIARDMLHSLRGRRRFEGARGRASVNPAELGRLLRALGRLAEKLPHLESLDLNPVLVTHEGLRVVDAKASLRPVEVRSARGVAPFRGDLAERAASVAPFFEARSVAVIGASKQTNKAGNVILRNLLRLGFSGDIFPVNPEGGEILGLPCARNLREIPARVELAVAVVPRAALPGVIEDCGAVGLRHLIISTAGFSDAGEEGRALEERLLKRARELGIRVMGPNSIGTVEVQSGLCTSLASIEPVPLGASAFLGQTGLFASSFPRWFSATGRYKARRFAALGNKGDVNEIDLLACMALDPEIRAVGLYVEGIQDGRALAMAIRETSRRKPVVVLRAGRTALGARVASSHTGALATDDRVAEAALREAGAITVGSFEELFDEVRFLEAIDPDIEGLAGPRGLGVVSITGVGCVLAADTCAAVGLDLPALAPETLRRMREVAPSWAPLSNPVDMWSSIEAVGPTEAYRRLSEALIVDPSIDMLLLVFISIPESEVEVECAFGALRALAPQKLVAASLIGHEPALDRLRAFLEELGIPCMGEPVHAVRSLARARAWARWRSYA